MPNNLDHNYTLLSSRVNALDIFRGLCIVGMVLVNNPGHPAYTFRWLRHSPWNGWTTADLIAPAFLWIVGFSIPLSFSKRISSGARPIGLQKRIAGRALTIYAVGVILDAGLSLEFWVNASALPAFGILQRIAICYLLIATVFLWAGPRGVLGTALASLTSYLGISYGFAFAHQLDNPFSQATSVGAWTDGFIVPAHLFASQSLVTALTGTMTVAIGAWAGSYFLRIPSAQDRLNIPLMFPALGIGTILAAQFLAHRVPFNLHLLTPSLVLLASGASLSLLSLLLILAHPASVARALQPIATVGRNPLLVYVLATLAIGLMRKIGVTYAGHWASLWSLTFDKMLLLSIPPQVPSLAMPLLALVVLYAIAAFLEAKRLSLTI